nr:A-agglutinin anchorage subunit-like [Penaeus vannamei]
MAGTYISILLRKMFVFFILCILLRVTTGKDIEGPQHTCTPATGCVEGWEAPRPECVDFRCRCPNDTCTVLTRREGIAQYSYYCGTCGTMGSECRNSSAVCQGGARCRNGYCMCDGGSIYREVCVRKVPVPTSTNSLVLVLVLVFLLILNKLITSRETLKKCLCRHRSDEDEESTVVGFNPHSAEKSAAFTITNSEFMAVSNDPDLDWALELSRQFSSRGEDWIPLAESTWSSNWSSRASGVDLETLRARLGSRSRTRGAETVEDEVEGEVEVVGAAGSSSSRLPSRFSRRSASTLSSSSSTRSTTAAPSARSTSRLRGAPRSSRSSSSSGSSSRPLPPTLESPSRRPRLTSSPSSSGSYPPPSSPSSSSTSYSSPSYPPPSTPPSSISPPPSPSDPPKPLGHKYTGDAHVPPCRSANQSFNPLNIPGSAL